MATDTLQNESDLRTFAEAWIDRFQAVGGSFGYSYGANKERQSAGMILPMPYTWTPRVEHNPALSPRDLILDEGQHEGAVKMLMSFLALVPGLKSEVYPLAKDRGLLIDSLEVA